jgi:hypothetical protein
MMSAVHSVSPLSLIQYCFNLLLTCPEGMTQMDENTADARIVNDLGAAVCCTAEDVDVDFDVVMSCPATGDVGVMTTSTEETETTTEEGDDEETTTTSSNGGANDCCLTPGDESSCPEGKMFMGEYKICATSSFSFFTTDLHIYFATLEEADTVLDGDVHHTCCVGGNIEMELETINLCGTSDVQTASTTDEEDVDEETTTTTSSGGGGASDCCLIASDSSCPDGKTYMGEFLSLYRLLLP